MTTYEPPTALPRAVLERADMRAAIAAHDFGTVFALARSEAGISYSKIAAECDIKPERVGALARGHGSVTTFEKITRIADALRIPGRMLGLAPRQWETPFSLRRVLPAPAQAIDADGDDVQRRKFFKVTAGVGLAVGLPDLIHPLAGRRVGSGVPQQLRERTARLRRLDDILGGGDTYRVYLGEYQATKALVREATYTEETGRALLSVLSEQAQQAGWAAFDGGMHDDAAGLYEESYAAAADAGDTALAGNALAFLAYQKVNGDHQAGTETAARSCETAGSDAPPGVRALLYERLAWAYAVAGLADETERALQAADAALSEPNDEPQPDWVAWVDENELRIMTGRCWTELRRPLRAIPALETALAQYDDTHARDKSLYLSWLAESYMTAGEVEQAAVVTGRALDLCAGVASVRPRQRLVPVLDRLGAYHAVPAVSEVLERARA
ncbi:MULTISPECIES: helix-turn-helix domain-containing protein [unclassified Streptomyces]|uniref:helix-turn-helix domain-containing protein n=1 Tax=unclassified Streptomyces TaxID=2593676 RepID=UPI00166208C2|nr:MULTISPECIES: helix-turn-helix domain-containing protein [unclassified Streptomyces]MBD0842241.1 helix-turn-helix transcriptional regulator [Streptomyces sp. TRM68416]